jgi:surface protein
VLQFCNFEGIFINGVLRDVTNMRWMFCGASLNQNLSAWDVSSVTTMERIFQTASAFNQDLSSAWDVSGVKFMPHMFNSVHLHSANTSVHGIFPVSQS